MKFFALIPFIFSCLLSFAQDRILVDGKFEEWDNLPLAHEDATGDGANSGIDFKDLQIFDDNEFIFFSIETDAEINLQDLNEISIYLDTDNNANTGFAINGIGAELTYNFGRRSGYFHDSANSIELFHGDIGLVSAPTVTSDRFEIAIRRDIKIFGIPIFQSNKLKVVFKDVILGGDLIPNTNQEIEYVFSTDNLPPQLTYSLQKTHISDLRIMTYNVLFDGFFEPRKFPSFSRIFQATQPDIIGFQEIYDYTSQQVADQVETILPSTSRQWYHAKEGPDCHAISRYPILESALIKGQNSRSGNGAFLIDAPGIETGLLLIVAHLPCCGNDFGRQIEVDLIMAFIREAKKGNGPIPIEANTPIVILGDMNLVGDQRQLETLITGDIYDEFSNGPDFSPDWNGENLLDSHPYATGIPFSFTWYFEGSSFSPGRLDYILYSGSNLKLQNNYSLFTPSLPQDSLSAFNLLADDVLIASDHLPVIADFQYKNMTDQQDRPAQLDLGILKIHPNPSHGLTEVIFNINQKEFVAIRLINQSGKEMSLLHQNVINSGKHNIKFNTSNLPSGLYFIKMETSRFIDVRKINVVK